MLTASSLQQRLKTAAAALTNAAAELDEESEAQEGIAPSEASTAVFSLSSAQELLDSVKNAAAELDAESETVDSSSRMCSISFGLRLAGYAAENFADVQPSILQALAERFDAAPDAVKIVSVEAWAARAVVLEVQIGPVSNDADVRDAVAEMAADSSTMVEELEDLLLGAGVEPPPDLAVEVPEVGDH